MDIKEFYSIVKAEGLDKYNISDSEESRGVANVIGIAEDNGWVVFETDERAQYHVISRHSSEGECLEALLEELRNKKRVEEIMKKLRGGRNYDDISAHKPRPDKSRAGFVRPPEDAFF